MFFRKVSFLAFSAFSLLSSVHTPRTVQPPEVVPVFPRHPVCWWNEYEPEVLPFSPANAFTNGSVVLAQGPLDTFPVLAQVNIHPSVSFDLAGTDLAHTAPASLKLAGSHPASPNIAGFDLASLDELEGVFTATMALARLLKHKTGVVWSKLAISLLILSGMLALDALQMGEPGFLLAVLHCLPAKIIFAKTYRRFCQVRSSILQGPLLLVLLSLLNVPLLDVVLAVALDHSLASLFILALPRSLHRIVSPTPAPYARKKKLFKRQRLKARQAREAASRSWYDKVLDAFLLALPTVLVLPFDVPWFDIVYALFLNGTIVDLLTRNIPGVWPVLRIIFPPPVYRVRRAKERYKRSKKKKLP